jgi:hypothetical protein
VTLVGLAVLGAGVIWVRQQDAARRAAEARAETAEAELNEARASLTAISLASAATATAVAEASQQPEIALRRALDLVLEAYRDPTEGRLKALSSALGPNALGVERPEAEHLISGGTHLSPASSYDVQILSTSPKGPGQTEIHTREMWTYDEVDAQNRRSRCVREDSEQTYTLRRVTSGWLVDDIQLNGPTRRTDC